MQWKPLITFIIAYFIGIFLAGLVSPMIPANLPFVNFIVLLLPPTVIWLVLRKVFKKAV